MAKIVVYRRVWLVAQIDTSDKPDGKHARIEKYLLRKAFDRPEHPYLPEDVLWRQKEQFSDGVGYDWVDGLKIHAQKVTVCQMHIHRLQLAQNAGRLMISAACSLHNPHHNSFTTLSVWNEA